MKKIWIIFKKEFTDILRDRRTIMFMIVFPLVLIPLMMSIMGKVTISQKQKAQEKVMEVGLITRGNAQDFRDLLKARDDLKLNETVKVEEIGDLLQKETLDMVVVFEEQFDAKATGKTSGNVQIHYKASSQKSIFKGRMKKLLVEYEDQLLDKRLQAMELSKEFVHPLDIQEVDLASMKEKLGEMIGGLLPYIFVIFCFLGAMYPAIDLAAGEKEQSTLETLLSSSAERMHIVTGKFLVITCTGLVSAVLSMVGLFAAASGMLKLPKHILEAVLRIVEFKSLAMVFSLLLPLCVFFAAALLCFSIYAKSFKEAQSIITPLNFMVIIPVAIGMVPGIKLDVVTASIPILNVSLACKEIIAGTIKTGLLAEVYLSLFLLAGAGLYFCAQWFKREDVIFRGI